MFQEIERPFSFAGWVLQLIFAYCAPVIVLAVLDGAIHATDSAAWQVFNYGVVCLLSVAAAWGMSALVVGSVREGRWVWVLPASVELLCVIAMFFSEGLSGPVALFYTGNGPMAGEESWGVVLLTIPTWSCCWYSVTMYWRRRRQNNVPLGSRFADSAS